MRKITASDLMNPGVVTVGEDLTVQELARFLLDNEISGAPVVDSQGRAVGVVSMVDIATAASEEEATGGPGFYDAGWHAGLDDDPSDFEGDDDELQVADIMNPEVHAVEEDAPVSEVATLMLEKHVHRLLVMRGEEIVGIISTSDLLGLLVDES